MSTPKPITHSNISSFFYCLNPIQTVGASTLHKKLNYFKTIQAMTTKLSTLS